MLKELINTIMLRISGIEIRKFDACNTSVYNSIVLYESVHSLMSLKSESNLPTTPVSKLLLFNRCFFE